MKAKHDILLSNFAFNCNPCHYTVEAINGYTLTQTAGTLLVPGRAVQLDPSLAALGPNLTPG